MDRRRATRYPADFTVRCRLRNGEESGVAINLSRGGLLLRTPNPLAVGTLLELNFAVPGYPTIKLKAVVRHSTAENEAGIEFIEVLPHEQEQLEGYLDYLDLSHRAAAGAAETKK